MKRGGSLIGNVNFRYLSPVILIPFQMMSGFEKKVLLTIAQWIETALCYYTYLIKELVLIEFQSVQKQYNIVQPGET